jgi:hypothetical protein
LSVDVDVDVDVDLDVNVNVNLNLIGLPGFGGHLVTANLPDLR